MNIADMLIRKSNISVFKYMKFSNNEAIKRAVEAAGIALVSQGVAKKEIQMGKLTVLPVVGVFKNRQAGESRRVTSIRHHNTFCISCRFRRGRDRSV